MDCWPGSGLGLTPAIPQGFRFRPGGSYLLEGRFNFFHISPRPRQQSFQFSAFLFEFPLLHTNLLGMAIQPSVREIVNLCDAFGRVWKLR